MSPKLIGKDIQYKRMIRESEIMGYEKSTKKADGRLYKIT